MKIPKKSKKSKKSPKNSEKSKKSENNKKNSENSEKNLKKNSKNLKKSKKFIWGFKIRTPYLGVDNPWNQSVDYHITSRRTQNKYPTRHWQMFCHLFMGDSRISSFNFQFPAQNLKVSSPYANQTTTATTSGHLADWFSGNFICFVHLSGGSSHF